MGLAREIVKLALFTIIFSFFSVMVLFLLSKEGLGDIEIKEFIVITFFLTALSSAIAGLLTRIIFYSHEREVKRKIIRRYPELLEKKKEKK